MQLFKTPNIDFIKYRWHAVVLSLVVIVAGLAVVFTRGIPLGVEFSGGTVVVLQFEGQAPTIDRVRAALDNKFPGNAGNVVVQSYGPRDMHAVMVRVPQVGQEAGANLRATANAVNEAIAAANLGRFKEVGTEVVGPTVGRDLTRKGFLATALALGGILIYVALRFQFSFAVGAITASIHDLLVTMAFLAFFQYDITLNVIAAILTLTGYSINDTIVIFDRVRENLRGTRRDKMRDVINVAVNQTLGRTVITAGTVLLSVLALFIFGGDVLRGFAFTMLVGAITGTYSTVFIAAAIVSFWPTGAGRRVAVAAPAARSTGSSPAPATAPRARTKSQRKARAS